MGTRIKSRWKKGRSKNETNLKSTQKRQINNSQVPDTKPSVIDLFCGIGGLGLGAVRAGFNLALSVDNNSIALDCHRKNFPGFRHLDTDVANLSGAELLKHVNLTDKRLSGLIGGPPCQGFSRIGHRKKTDPRNLLFTHFFRLVKETEPLFFLAENVPGIMDKENDEIRKYALGLIPQSYSTIEPFCLNASDFGAPTTRERVFFFGFQSNYLGPILQSDFEARKSKEKNHVELALAGLPKRLKETWLNDDKGWRKLRCKPLGNFWTKIHGSIPAGVGDSEVVNKLFKESVVSSCIATIHSSKVTRRFSGVKPGQVDEVSRAIRLKRNGLCPTLRAGTGPERGSFQALRPIHFSEPRVISPREAARLQGFPDWFRLNDTKWHSFRGIGNSVSPLLSEEIFSVIKSKFKVGPRRAIQDRPAVHLESIGA